MNIIKYNSSSTEQNKREDLDNSNGLTITQSSQASSTIVQDTLWKKSLGQGALVPSESDNAAEGKDSAAIGTSNNTINQGEFAIGQFNSPVTDYTMFTIGNGTDDTHRSNAFKVNADGDTYVAGDLNVGINATFGGDIHADGKVDADGDISSDTKLTAPTITGTQANFTNLNVTVKAVLKALEAEDITTEKLTVTKAAHFFELIIDQIKSTQGQIIITPANAKFDLVENQSKYYRCYWKYDDDSKQIGNQFAVNDQVVCQTFNVTTGTSHDVANKYYWALVTGIGTTTINGVNYHYIDVSRIDKDSKSNGVPQVGDEVAQLGNRTDTSRQAAIIISAYNNSYLDANITAPSIVQYSGINNYNLASHRLNVISKGLNSFKGEFTTTAGNNLGTQISQLTNNVNGIQSTVSNHTTSINGLQSEIDDINYVGINLVMNGAFRKKFNYWSNWGTPTTRNIVDADGKKWLYVASTTTTFQGVSQRRYTDYGITIEPDTEYTVSMVAKTNGASTGKVCAGFHYFSGSEWNIVSQNWCEFDIDATAKRYSATFTTPSNISNFNIMVGDRTDVAQEFYITEVKLEKGNKATDWNPSTQETDADINQLTTYTSQIDQKADSISTTVSQLRSGTDNLFNFTECNFSTNDYQSVLPAVQSYGIECKQPLSRVYNLGFDGEGGDFTVSFECKLYGLSSANVFINMCDKTAVESTYFSAVESEWRKFAFTFKNVSQYIGGSSDKQYNGFIDFENSSFTSSKFLVVRHLMISRGTMASTFTVSSKDCNNNDELLNVNIGYAANLTNTGDKYLGFDVYESSNIPTTGVYDYCSANDLSLKQHKIYTMSFYAKGSVNGIILTSYFYGNGGQVSTSGWQYKNVKNLPYGSVSEGNFGDGSTSYSLTTEWKHYVIYFNNWNSGLRNAIFCRYVVADNTSISNPSFQICGVQLYEGYWLENQINSQSRIVQTSDSIMAQVNDTSLRIDTGQITLNGNTRVEGNLQITNSTDGLTVTNGQNKFTQIKPISIGNYDESSSTSNFYNFLHTSKTLTSYVTQLDPPESSRCTVVFRDSDNKIYLNASEKITLSLFSSFKMNVSGLYVQEKYYDYYVTGSYTPSTSSYDNSRVYCYGYYGTTGRDEFFSFHIYRISTRISILNQSGTEVAYTVINGNTPTLNLEYTASATGTYTIQSVSTIQFNKLYTTINKRTDLCIRDYINLSFDLVISKALNSSSISNTIGYDGINLKFGSNKELYFGQEQGVIRYGNNKLKLNEQGIFKYAGLTGFHNASEGAAPDELPSKYMAEYAPLNGCVVRQINPYGVTSTKNCYLQPRDEFIRFLNGNTVTHYLILGEPSQNVGRKVYFKNVGSSEWRICASRDSSNVKMMSSDQGTNWYIKIENYSSMIISDGNYWVYFRMD